MDDLYKRYFDSSLHFLSFRPRSEKEVRVNLLKKSAPQEIIDKILNWLKEHRFVNDEEFVRWWMEERLRFKPKAIRIIKLELKQKGISKEIIEKIMANGPDQIGIPNGNDHRDKYQMSNDFESAKKIVEKRLPKYKGLKKYEIYKKLGSYLAQKGFDWDTIKKSIDDAFSEC
jgi:regulatory protein